MILVFVEFLLCVGITIIMRGFVEILVMEDVMGIRIISKYNRRANLFVVEIVSIYYKCIVLYRIEIDIIVIKFKV